MLIQGGGGSKKDEYMTSNPMAVLCCQRRREQISKGYFGSTDSSWDPGVFPGRETHGATSPGVISYRVWKLRRRGISPTSLRFPRERNP